MAAEWSADEWMNGQRDEEVVSKAAREYVKGNDDWVQVKLR